MNLSTKYLGLELKSPVIVSSSSLTNSVSKIKKAADAGAGAVVLKSLFEEQLVTNPDKLISQSEMYFWFPEAIEQVNKFPKEEGVEEYLNLIREAKNSVSIPVIASINCVSPNEWPTFTKKIEEAGADGIELNIFIPPTNEKISSEQIEKTYSVIVREVKKNTNLPVAVKIGSYFTNLAKSIINIDKSGADAIVLFNRYFSPDIDIDKLTVNSSNFYSNKEEISNSLRWVSLMSGKVEADLAGSTGIHDAPGVIKEILAGASAAQISSVLYKNGVEYISTINSGIEAWMDEKGFKSLNDFKGLVSSNDENKAYFERVQFMKKTAGQSV